MIRVPGLWQRTGSDLNSKGFPARPRTGIVELTNKEIIRYLIIHPKCLELHWHGVPAVLEGHMVSQRAAFQGPADHDLWPNLTLISTPLIKACNDY